ncbi:hypothetical protein ACR03S_10315 [Limimaricola variabilis]
MKSSRTDLERDEIYQQFVHELATELMDDASKAFAEAGCQERHRPHFMTDLRDAIASNIRSGHVI